MNKKFFITLFIVVILLAGCKSTQTPEEKLAEKKSCYKECMLVENDKAYCLDDCEVEEKDVEVKEVCGDSICQSLEQQSGLCPADCGCMVNSDCDAKEICENTVCTPVDCTLNSHCPEGRLCENNECIITQTFDEGAVTELQNDIIDLQDNIQELLDDINALQSSLDAAEASDDDKDAIQEDIDGLDTTITQLNTYNSTLNGYLDDLESVDENSETADVGTAFNTTKSSVTSYIASHEDEITDIEDAIAALEPEAQADVIIDDFDLEDVEDQTGVFTITIANDDDGNITTAQTFRIQLTSYKLDNSTLDDTRETITAGLSPDEDMDIEMSVEIIDLEDYFSDYPNATSVVLRFLVEVDIDNSINESNEANNNKTYNVTFDREDYVSNTAPVAVITTSATTISNMTGITFSGTSSTDSDGSISSYSWNFGDSTTSTSSSITHTYSDVGNYTVTLTVTDNDGATDTETVSVTVV
jgi:peptidoglycan hydrolase CwlO-like protein